MTDSANLLRSDDLWLEDGNVILIAGNVAFKVHRGQLARHSDIFRDLFMIPQPEDQQKLEGCFVVELHDSPSDLSFLLRALYDGLYFYKPYANDWQAIEAILRLSTKYFIERLHHRCLSRVVVDWPINLDKWDVRERDSMDELGKYSPRLLSPHPVLVIKLARELDELAFALPSAFYDLSRYGPKKIVSGTLAPIPLEFHTHRSRRATAAEPSIFLSTQEIIQVLTGREHGQRFMTSFVEHTLRHPAISSQCFNKDNERSKICRQSFYYIMLNTLRSIGGIALGRDADPLFTLSQTEGMLDRTDFCDGTDPKVLCALNICAACKSDFRAKIKVARADVWRLIPTWFGLPSYEESKGRGS